MPLGKGEVEVAWRSVLGIFLKKSQLAASVSRSGIWGSRLMAFLLLVGLVLDGADVDAGAAAGAVLGGDLEGGLHAGELLALRVDRLEGGGGALGVLGLIGLEPDDGVGADHGALAALDADLRIPHGDLLGDVALLVLGGAGGEGAVLGELGDLEALALVGDHLAEDSLTNCGASAGTGLFMWSLRGGLAGYFDLVVSVRARSMAAMFFCDDVGALPVVGLLRVLLDELDGLVLGEDAGDLEEGGLHDGVDAAAHAGLLGDGHAVDHVEAELLVDDGLLDLGGDLVPDLVGGEGAVEEEDAALLGVGEHVELLEEGELVAGDEVGLAR